jgi:hypothetical protein
MAKEKNNKTRPKSPKRQKNDGFYKNNAYKQRSQYESKELQILENRSDKGYAVSTPNISPDNKGENWNVALLSPFGAYMKLWVNEIKIDFSLSGTTGQSRYRRQFFPRAFNQPRMIVSGSMPNQKEYNRLASFVRECHFAAVTGTQDFYANKEGQSDKARKGASVSAQTISLLVKDSGPSVVKSAPLHTKGGHLPLKVEGYITNIRAGATKFNFAPDFEFEFIPAYSVMKADKIGIYEDIEDDGSHVSSWMDIYKVIGPQQRNPNQPLGSGQPVRNPQSTTTVTATRDTSSFGATNPNIIKDRKNFADAVRNGTIGKSNGSATNSHNHRADPRSYGFGGNK